jgi:hypothetical protein
MNMTTQSPQDAGSPFLRSRKDFDPLCESWERAWKVLTSKRPYSRITINPESLLDRTQEFALQMWALIDQPQAYRCAIDFESAQASILDFAKQKPYPDTPLVPGEFRLLHPEARDRGMPARLTLSKFPVQNCPQRYAAVSYCWGPPIQDQKVAFVNGRPVVISATSLRIIDRLIAWARGFYWIDALCINQNLLEEKNMQLPLMGRIFGDAEFVDAWLDSAESEYPLQRISQDNSGWQTDLSFVEKVDVMLRQPWFKRIWVVQEVTLARPNALVLHTGFSSCRWEKLREFLDQERTLQITLVNSPLCYALIILAHTIATCGVANLELQRGEHWPGGYPKPQPHWSLWFKNLATEATDPRDKVYGVLGMVSQDWVANFPVDYSKSVPEVYLDATISLMTDNPYMFARMLYGAPVLSTRDKFGSDSPSWVLDFSSNGRPWGQNFLQDTWRDAWRGDVPASLSSQFRIKDRNLMSGASIVDEIEYLIRCPSKQVILTTLDPHLTDMFEQGKLAQQVITSLVRFLSEAHKLYSKGSAASELWDQGRSVTLWQLILRGPKTAAGTLMDSGIFRDEFANKFAALIKDDADPVAAFAESQSLSEILNGNLLSLDPMSFFVTKHGLGGFCVDGAEVGDTVSVLFRDISDFPDIPYIIRPRGDGSYAMITVAWLPKYWKHLSRFRQTLDPETIIIR